MERILLFLLYGAITANIGRCLDSTLCVKLPDSLQSFSNRCSKFVTLQELYQNPEKHIHSNTHNILFEGGQHVMNGVLNIQQKENLAFANYDGTVIINCSKPQNTGFNFTSVQGLSIENLTFQNCDNIHSAVLTFDGGSHLNISHVTINESKGPGVHSVNVNGTTIVTNLTLLSSHITSQFIYNASRHLKGKLVIKDSLFHNNSLNAQLNSILFICINNSVATAQIQNTTFSNNSGNLGIHLLGTVMNKSQIVSIENCNFTQGNVSKGGGGLYLNTSVHDDAKLCNYTKIAPNISIIIISICSVLFDGNNARVGGGIYMEQKNHPDACTSKFIYITNSNFTNNALVGNERGGTALHSITYILKGPINQMIPQYKPILKGCIFKNNRVTLEKSDDYTEATGTGVIFVNKNEYFEIDNITVANNTNCSAILSVTSNIVLRGTILLFNNTAASGGGLLLCKNGILYFTPHTNLTIINNNVSHSGGGICVEAQCLQTRPRCFFQLHEVENFSMIDTVNVILENNRAGYAGDDIFGGLVDFCYMLDDPIYSEGGNISFDIFTRIFHMNKNSTVTSIPQHVCLCNGVKQPNCSNNSLELKPFEVYPGENFHLVVVLAGQLNGTVPGFVHAEVVTTDNISLDVYHDQKHLYTENCTELKYALNSSCDESINATLNLTVDHSGDISGYVKIPSNKPLSVKVTIKPCPIGFQLKNGTCNCTLLNQKTSMHCDISKKVIVKDQRKKSWIGVKNGQVVFHTNCPYDYCITDKRVHINVTAKDTLCLDNQCQFNRTGILCGACPRNLSMVLGSSECRACPSKIFTLILIFGLAGLLLVVFLTCLNLTIAEGTLSGLIFYVNIVWHNNDLFKGLQQDSTFSKLLHVFLAWLNLDLGITTCFYDGMDTYQKAWLQFAFPVYVWTISFVIIFLSNRFQVVAKIASSIAVKVLATLILLSYTKFVRAAVRIFAFTSLNSIEQAKNDSIKTMLWLEDANVEYWNKKHLVLFCFGVFCLALVSPYTLTLLFIKQLQSLAHWRVFKWVQTLKPFLDAYTGPYTKHGRFWPGLLLLVRVILSVLSGINCFESDKTRFLFGIFIILLLLSVSKSVKQGLYEKHYLDKLETSSLLNLGLLYLVTFHSIKYAYEVLVGASFFTFLCIVVYHMWLKCCRYTCTAKIISTVVIKVALIRAKFKTRQKSMDRLQNYPPYVQFTEDREPLLADYED